MRRTAFEPPPSPANSSPPPTPTHQPKELPKWFELRPFQYNGRVFITALPGLCLALSLSGELLLGIVVIGGLIVHFMQSGGARRRAVLAFLFIVIAAQVSIIYAALPLVWESVYNIVTILLLNMSVVMTGGWILIHFEEFLREEPSLAEIIEMSLFTIFPTVSVAIFCCMLAMLTSSHYIPYSIIVHGFLLLRVFVTPSQPSFRKQCFGSNSTSNAFILGHAEVSILLILYVSAPAELFIIINVWNLLSLITLMKLLFMFFLPCFLVTLLELRTWTDCYGIPYRYIIWLRWTTGLGSLFLGSVLLSQMQDLLLVHWLSVTILANVLLGWTATQKGHMRQTFKFICGLAVIFIYVLALQYSIPWHLNLPDVDLTMAGFALIMNAVLSVVCFLACDAQNQRLSSTLLVTFIGGMVYIESFLYMYQLYPFLLVLCSSAMSSYLLVRLLSAGVITWHCVWIGSALHAFKLPFLVEVLIGKQLGAGGSVSGVALTLAVTKLLCFEWQEEVSSMSALGHIFAISLSLLICYQSLLQPLSYILYNSSPTVLQVVWITVAFTATVCLKLTTQHLRHTPVARKLNILVLASTGLAFIVQPSCALEQYNLSCWLTFFAGTLAAAIMLGIVSPKQSVFVMFSQSVIIGLAAGLKASELLFATPSTLSLLQYSLSCMACSFILLCLWTSFMSKRSRRKQLLLKPAVCFLTIVGSVTYITEVSQVTKTNFTSKDFLSPCLQLYCFISILLGLVLRLYCLLLQSRDPFGFAPNQVSTISNLVTITAYLLSCLNCPLQPWEIWHSGCALLFLNLQQDPDIVTSLTPKRRTGIVIGACLLSIYSASVMHSDLFQEGLGLFALLEAVLFVATLPVFATFVQHQVISNHVLNTELVIFLTPLNALFFLIGSSYTSWLLGGIGLSVGIRMLVEKLSIKDLY